MDFQLLASGESNVEASTYHTDSYAVRADQLVLLFVVNAPSAGSPTNEDMEVSGNNLSWHEQTSLDTSDGNHRLTCFAALADTATDGPATFDFFAQQEYCAWSVIAYTGVDTSGSLGPVPVKQVALNEGQGSLKLYLIREQVVGQNRFVAAIAIAGNDGIAPQPGQFYTERAKATVPKQGATLVLQTVDTEQTDFDPSWTWSADPGAQAIAVGVELSAWTEPPAPTPQERMALLATYMEPVLRLHESEPWRPTDPGSFWAAANKWTVVEPPPDDKTRWGGSSDAPFPRSAAPLGTTVTGGNWFLELGGWIDQNGTAQDGVTSSSINRYTPEPATEKGTGWYGFEFFNNEQLLDLASSGSVLDLTSVVKSVPNAMLLCYYYFFPYHRQSVDGTNIEAKMLASHVGDWQCIAIMLGGPGDYPTTGDDPIPATLPPPVFVGCTGLRPAVNPDGTYPPYQFDEESRTVMKVAQWQPSSDPSTGSPEEINIGGFVRPVFYVAAGTHSIYLSPGEHDVDPFPPNQQPQVDGMVDAPVPLSWPDPPKIDDRVVLLKVALGGLFLPALLWAAVEASPSEPDVNEIEERRAAGGDPTPSPGDQTAAPGQGFIIVPGWAARDDASRAYLATDLGYASSDIEAWAWGRIPGWSEAEQGPIGNPEMLVDRSTQDWWPPENRMRGVGFTGRWGQNVNFDPLARRAGPRMPEYWRLFLLALEDGKTKKAFDFPFDS